MGSSSKSFFFSQGMEDQEKFYKIVVRVLIRIYFILIFRGGSLFGLFFFVGVVYLYFRVLDGGLVFSYGKVLDYKTFVVVFFVILGILQIIVKVFFFLIYLIYMVYIEDMLLISLLRGKKNILDMYCIEGDRQ